MNIAFSHRQRQRNRVMLLALLVSLLVCVIGIPWQAYWRYQHEIRRSEWMDRMKERGARAVLSKYRDANLLARFPVLNPLTLKTMLKVYLPNSRVAESVIELLSEYPELERLWIDKRVDPEIVERIQKARPNVRITIYTNESGFTVDLPQNTTNPRFNLMNRPVGPR